MASALQFTLCFIVLIAAMLAYNILDSEMSRKHKHWMVEHGRVYTDKAEKARRLEIFKNNVKYIEDFNKAGKRSYSLGINEFADLTSEEFMETHTCGATTVAAESEESPGSVDTESLEFFAKDAVDWRSSMTRVKKQGKCGCCYIFATVATVETVYYQYDGRRLRSLSVQQVLDCNRKVGDGCHGGSRAEVYDYIIKNKGLNTEENYPYKEAEKTCDVAKEKVIKAHIGGYARVPHRSEAELKKAVSKRPVAIAIKTPKDWQFYTAGVFNGKCGDNLDHAMVVAGYGEDAGSDKYWLLRNSWGSSWGDGGYVKVKRDVADPDGYCGIVRNQPLYPTI